ncbi:phosphopantetheine-binding protein [Saccharopolyspora sp. K220]|uniref:acyl carrier protein n=1 Tax=Saccharopolyspora soli TaxID=2926618 RepID=UPI001F55C263|nr:phosphopantetheine-binding protein [Saccharopolyspora soli]MCI2416686.1 phosphopantetheine-binding protein [Saccharopolyspora soli]
MRSSESVLDELKKMVVELTDLPARALTAEACLTTDLGLDELSLAQLLTEAEQRFGVQIPDRVLRPGLRDLADYILTEARRKDA